MAGRDEVRLLGAWASPFAMRPRFALNLKKVPCELVEQDPFDKSELLLKSNPVYKKIPVLFHGDRVICESMIIVDYIDGVWSHGPSIVPSDPYDKATACFWSTYIDDKWFPAFRSLGSAAPDQTAALMEQLFEGLQLLEGAFEKCSKGKPFFGGDTVGYLDIAFGCYVGWIKAAEKMFGIKFLDEGKTPLLVGWAERFCAEEAVREVMPETDKLVEYFNMVQAKRRAAEAPSN